MLQETPASRFVQRMKTERTAREWSQERLVKEVAARTGYQLNATVVTKLEWILDPARQGKARGLGLDEALAIAQTFGLTVPEMVEPPQDRLSVLARELTVVQDKLKNRDARRAAIDLEAKLKIAEIAAEMDELGRDYDRLNKQMIKLTRGSGKADDNNT